MSMGGNGGQMPMASNRGQQQQMGQQQPQGMMPMYPGMAPQSGMMPQMGGNQIKPQNPAALFAPQVYQQPFGTGAMPMQTNQPPGMMGGQMPQMAQQVSDQPMMGGGMGSMPRFANQQAYDDFMAQGGMQGVQDRMAGIGALGGQMPPQGLTKKQYFEMYGAGGGPGMTMIDDGGMGRPSIGTQGPGDGLAPSLPARSLPPAYGPTKGPIDGRKLRDMMDIRTRRPVDGLPNALENNLPPSLKRPTQNRRG